MCNFASWPHHGCQINPITYLQPSGPGMAESVEMSWNVQHARKGSPFDLQPFKQTPFPPTFWKVLVTLGRFHSSMCAIFGLVWSVPSLIYWSTVTICILIDTTETRAMESIHSNSWIFAYSSLLLRVSRLIWWHLFDPSVFGIGDPEVLILSQHGRPTSDRSAWIFQRILANLLRQFRHITTIPLGYGCPSSTCASYQRSWLVLAPSSDQDVVFSMPPWDVPQKVQKVREVGFQSNGLMLTPLGEVPFGRAYPVSPCLPCLPDGTLLRRDMT